MISMYGLVTRATRHAMRTSYSDTKRGLKYGSKHKGTGEPITEGQKAFYGRLKRLAPKPRRKRLRSGPF